MKKQLLCTLTMLAFLSTGVARADHHEGSHHTPPDERTSMIASLAIMTLAGAIIHVGGDKAKISGASKNLLQAANILYSVGQIADKPVLRDMAVRTLIAGASAGTATSPYANSHLLPYMPLGLGQSLIDAQNYGTGVITVGLYKLYGYLYEYLVEGTRLGTHLGATPEKDL